MVPDIGGVLIPPHLRVLFVSQEPCILLDLTLWENLTMGCPSGVDQGLVVSILQEMGMSRVIDALEQFQDGPVAKGPNSSRESVDNEYSASDELLAESSARILTEKEEEDIQVKDMEKKKQMAFWFEKLNYSEKAKIHLARAFIMNPEVIVMHRPLYHFDDVVGRCMLGLVRQHHRNRGLCMPTATMSRRRPRTVFMTTEAEWQEGAADVTWHLDVKEKSLVENKPSQGAVEKFHASQNDIGEAAREEMGLRPSEMGRRDTTAMYKSHEHGNTVTGTSSTREDKVNDLLRKKASPRDRKCPAPGDSAWADMDWCFTPKGKNGEQTSYSMQR
jgi:hypothetical protein